MAVQRRLADPSSTLKRAMFAMVVLDMQEATRGKLAHPGGNVEECIRRTADVIKAVRELGRPVILVAHENTPAMLHEISEAAGPGAVHFNKTLQSAFSIPAFRRFLKESLTDALIIAGWMKGVCVRDTMLDAIWDGYRVLTCDDILFDRKDSRPMEALLDYERSTHAPAISYYDTSDSLLAFIRSRTRWDVAL